MKRGLSFILVMTLICTVLVSCTPSEYSELEKVSGMKYGEFLEKNIFKPLKMNNTC